MGSKVVHIPDAIHNAAKRYCTANKLAMSQWVVELIVAAVPELKARKQTPVGKSAPVSKHTPDEIVPPKDVEAVISGPPFWENR
jgi:hypothetical protein